MKQKHTFNAYLLKYNKYLSKLNRLQITGRNLRRQNILKKHIARLEQKLSFLLRKINHTRVATAMAVTGMVAISNNTQAQTFGTAQTNSFGLTDIGDYSSPAFVDLDNDGDLDMLSGDFRGNFSYFENTGTSSAPAFATVQTNSFGLTDIGHNSAPAFVDLDNDGDFDMISGDRNGQFYYFENTGTSSAPAFATVQTNPFNLTDIGVYSAPALVDLDNDGDFDLLTSDYAYYNHFKFLYFENTGTNTAPSFGTVQTNPFNLIGIYGYYSVGSPVFADLDNDGDFDLLSGHEYGKFHYYENTTTLSNTTIKSNNTALEVLSNPALEIVSISVLDNISIMAVSILNTTGKTVVHKTFNNSNSQVSLSTNHLTKGVYIAKVNTSQGIVTKKLIIQ